MYLKIACIFIWFCLWTFSIMLSLFEINLEMIMVCMLIWVSCCLHEFSKWNLKLPTLVYSQCIVSSLSQEVSTKSTVLLLSYLHFHKWKLIYGGFFTDFKIREGSQFGSIFYVCFDDSFTIQRLFKCLLCSPI